MTTGARTDSRPTFSWSDLATALDVRVATQPATRSIRGVSTDTRTLGDAALFVALRGPNFDGHDFVPDALARGASAAIVARDVAWPPTVDRDRLVAVDDPLAALGRLGAFRRAMWGGPLCAVTGSCGKTTTKELTAHLLRSVTAPDNVLASPGTENNFIGVPRVLCRLSSDTRFAVVELGCNRPDEIGPLSAIAGPDVAVLTGIGAAHLEGLGSLDGVLAEKTAITRGLRPGGTVVINGDDARLVRWARAHDDDYRIVRVGLGADNDLRASAVTERPDGTRFEVQGVAVDSPLLGRHNVTNALLALAACRALGVSLGTREFAARMRHAPSAPGRMRASRAGGVLVVDDSYNANPTAMRAALTWLAEQPVTGRRIAILGDMRELGEGAAALHREIGKAASDCGIDVLWAVGPFACFFRDGFLDAGGDGTGCRTFEHADEAAAALVTAVAPGDAVLVKASRAVGLDAVSARFHEHAAEVGA